MCYSVCLQKRVCFISASEQVDSFRFFVFDVSNFVFFADIFTLMVSSHLLEWTTQPLVHFFPPLFFGSSLPTE